MYMGKKMGGTRLKGVGRSNKKEKNDNDHLSRQHNEKKNDRKKEKQRWKSNRDADGGW